MAERLHGGARTVSEDGVDLHGGNRDGLIRISQGVHGYLKENGVPHVWHVDGNAHDTTEWDNNLYLFSQHLLR